LKKSQNIKSSFNDKYFLNGNLSSKKTYHPILSYSQQLIV